MSRCPNPTGHRLGAMDNWVRTNFQPSPSAGCQDNWWFVADRVKEAHQVYSVYKIFQVRFQ